MRHSCTQLWRIATQSSADSPRLYVRVAVTYLFGINIIIFIITTSCYFWFRFIAQAHAPPGRDNGGVGHGMPVYVNICLIMSHCPCLLLPHAFAHEFVSQIIFLPSSPFQLSEQLKSRNGEWECRYFGKEILCRRLLSRAPTRFPYS